MANNSNIAANGLYHLNRDSAKLCAPKL